MAEHIATAVDVLDEFEISYELTPTDTVIEADDLDEVYNAAAAAHRAAGSDGRVVVSLEVDDQGGAEQSAGERVAAVEEALGRPAQEGAE